MFIKICGITTVDDALRAATLGADAVGFIFWPNSPRFIEPRTARAIVRRLAGRLRTVGVFVNQPLSEVNAAAASVGIDMVQLHGEENAEYCAAMTRPVIKTLALGSASAEEDVDRIPESATLLLDKLDPVRKGGTGCRVNWNLAARIALRRPTILAGGLNPVNVAAAVKIVEPYGIDISSGIEWSPGVKDPRLMEALFEALNRSRAGQAATARPSGER